MTNYVLQQTQCPTTLTRTLRRQGRKTVNLKSWQKDKRQKTNTASHSGVYQSTWEPEEERLSAWSTEWAQPAQHRPWPKDSNNRQKGWNPKTQKRKTSCCSQPSALHFPFLHSQNQCKQDQDNQRSACSFQKGARQSIVTYLQTWQMPGESLVVSEQSVSPMLHLQLPNLCILSLGTK